MALLGFLAAMLFGALAYFQLVFSELWWIFQSIAIVGLVIGFVSMALES